MFRLVVASFSMVAGLRTEAMCGPNVKLNYDGTAVPVESGKCFNIGSKAEAAEFCGPGTLLVSRMTCNNHPYKANKFVHDKTSNTGECVSYPLSATNANGW